MLNKTIKVLIGLISFNTLAQSIEVLGPVGLTYHPVTNSETCIKFSSRLSKNGCLIDNAQIGLVFNRHFDDKFENYVIFSGKDSVGSLMGGGLYERGYVYGNLELGFAAGTYLQDDKEYENRSIEPMQLGKINNNGIVPILGAAVNYRVYVDKNVYVKLNNIVSPALTNTTLALGYSF